MGEAILQLEAGACEFVVMHSHSRVLQRIMEKKRLGRGRSMAGSIVVFVS